MPPDRPDVSVVMAAWSAQDFIAPAIASALAQRGVSLEVILVDDASPDETLAAARAAAKGDERLVCARLAQNGGPSAARNRAIELARGRYIAVLDADDSFEPGRLARLVACADDTGADIVCDDMNRIAEIGACGDEGSAFLRPGSIGEGRRIDLATYLDPASDREFGENLGYLKPLIRAETLARTGLRYDAALRNSEDFYLIASLLAEGAHMRLIPEAGYNYLQHSGSISHRLTPALTAAILEADRHFETCYGAGLDDAARAALARRRHAIERSHAFECVIDRLKARQPARALGAAADRPAALPHIASRLAQIGWNKFFA